MTRPEDVIVAETIRMVREEIGPIASYKAATVVTRLPKTRSGKILRGTMKKIADGMPFMVPATIDDPAILDEIGAALAAKGYPRRSYTDHPLCQSPGDHYIRSESG